MNSLDFHSEQSYPIQVVLEASQAPQNRRILSKGNISVLKALCSKGDGRQRCCSDHRCQSYSWISQGIPAGAIEKLMAKWRNRTSQNFTCLKWRFRHCLMGWVERGDPQSCLARHLQLLPRKYQSLALSTSSTNSRFR